MTEYRLTVAQDPDADGPIQWGRLVSVRTAAVLQTGGWQDQTPTGGTDDLDLPSVGEQMTGGRGFGGLCSAVVGDDDRFFEALSRWARLFHGVELMRWRPTGYSQSAWGDAIIYLPAEERDPDEYAPATVAQQRVILGALRSDLDAWYRGDVFIVGIEEKVTWQRVGENEHFRHTWEHVDSLGGCYLTDQYTANDVAREYFDAVNEGDADLPVVEITGY